MGKIEELKHEHSEIKNIVRDLWNEFKVMNWFYKILTIISMSFSFPIVLTYMIFKSLINRLIKNPIVWLYKKLFRKE